jgi:SNF2 family DNA or RNA helicase
MDVTQTRSDDQVIGKFKTKPYAHQLECLNRFGRRDAFALLAEMGTGKTWIAINNMADLWSSSDCFGALVLAPNGVHTNWTEIELKKHMPDWVRWRAVAWTATQNKTTKQALDGLLKSESGELRILTMNHEALQSKRGYEFAHAFLMSVTRAMIVVDEADAYKNPSTARTASLMKLKPLSKWRRIMTGTPVNNAPFDLFSQFSFLDETILRTTSFYAFKAEYADMLRHGHPILEAAKQRSRGRTPQIVARGSDGLPVYKNLDRLKALIDPHSFRVRKEECLDLPAKIYKTAVFDLTKEQDKVYDKVKEECRLVFEGDESVVTKLVALSKLAQITSGYYIHPMSEEPVRIPGENPKLDLLTDIVDRCTERGDKVIVWARYRVEIEDIAAAMRKRDIPYVEYHGGVNKGDRIDAIEAFERGDAMVFIGNQQAGGTGITLVSASHMIYFSNNFSLRDRLQSEDRAHRIGQSRNVVYTDLVARGTVDEKVIAALAGKKSVADAIVDGSLKDLWRS